MKLQKQVITYVVGFPIEKVMHSHLCTRNMEAEKEKVLVALES